MANITKPLPGFRIDRTHPLSGGLVAWWLFNDLGGSLAFNSANNRSHGSMVGTTWYGYTRGSSVLFNGSSSRIVVDPDPIELGPATFSFWMYIYTFGGSNAGRILDNGTLFLNPNFSSNQLFFSFNGSTTAQFSQLATVDTLRHIVLTTDGLGPVNAYLDGNFYGSSNAGTPSAGSGVLYIGNRAALNRGLDGYLDDVRIYNRVLSETEIFQLYSNPYANVLRQRTYRQFVEEVGGANFPPNSLALTGIGR